MLPTRSVQTLDINLHISRDAFISVHHRLCRLKNRWMEPVVCLCVTFIVPETNGQKLRGQIF